MAQPAPSRPRSGLDLPTDITDFIADMLLEQKCLTYDEQDISKDAAKCMLVGNPAFTSIGQTLYKAISPHLGEDPKVTEKSSISEMKAVLKSWKMPLGGSKPQLWQRIRDSVSVPEDSNDQLCPCSTATRNLVKELNEATISQSKAKDMFNLTKSDLESAKIPFEVSHTGRGFGGISYSYPLQDIKQLCIKRFGGWNEAKKAKDKSRAFIESLYQQGRDTKAAVTEVLSARGLNTEEGSRVERSLKRMWWLECNKDDPEAVKRAADRVHADVWFLSECAYIFQSKLLFARMNYKPRKQSGYKMDIDTEDYAKGLALEEWVRRQTGSLDTILADPLLPACLHNGVREAWQKKLANDDSD